MFIFMKLTSISNTLEDWNLVRFICLFILVMGLNTIHKNFFVEQQREQQSKKIVYLAAFQQGSIYKLNRFSLCQQ